MIQTQTIDIEHVRKVLQNCPHFDKIVNYEYPYGDTLSKKLIDWYRELIFSANGDNEKQLMLINGEQDTSTPVSRIPRDFTSSKSFLLALIHVVISGNL